MKKEHIFLVLVYILNSVLLLLYWMPGWLIKLYSIQNIEAQIVFQFLEYVVTGWSVNGIMKIIKKTSDNNTKIFSITAILFLILRFSVGAITTHDALVNIGKDLVNNN